MLTFVTFTFSHWMIKRRCLLRQCMHELLNKVLTHFTFLSTESRSDCTAKCGESLSLLSSREYANVQENWWKLNTNKWRKSSLFFLGELSKPFYSVAVQFASIQRERAKVSGKLDTKCLLERNPNLIYSLQLEMNSVLYVHKHAWHCIVHVLYCMLKVLWSEWKQIVFENHFYWFIRERMKRNKIKASCSEQVHISHHMTVDSDTYRLF